MFNPFARALRIAVLAAAAALAAGPGSAGCAPDGAGLALSDAQRAAVGRTVAATPYGRGLIWTVARGGHTSVVFGTMHLTDPVVAVVPEPVRRRIPTARIVLVETAESDQPSLPGRIAAAMDLRAPKGKSLIPSLSDAEKADLAYVLRPFGLTLQIADRLSPWMLAVFFSNPPCAMRPSPGDRPIMDRQIEASARAAGVPVKGLETFAEAARLLRLDRYDEEVALLKLLLPLMRRSEALYATARADYLRGEPARSWETGAAYLRARQPGAETERLLATARDALINRRNRAWMKWLLPELARGDALVAVGALHLPGPDGLLALLEAEGFAIRPLSD